jgi:murein DD-endopeptidase MepM/ murein hydrolase activator NlpD
VGFALSVAWFFVVAPVATTAPDSLAIVAEARAMQPGELVLLTVTGPESLDTLHVRAFSRDIPGFRVDARTWRALVGIDLGTAAGTYVALIDARNGPQQLHATYSLAVQSRRFPSRTLNVDPAFVNPPVAMRDRIAREATQLEQLWTHSSPERVWNGPFVVPVPGATASRFGARSIFNGQARSPHSGADYVSPTGTSVGAPNAGRVVLAQNLYFSGNTVVLDHGLGLFSLLAHLSVIDVREGDAVSSGQEIGTVGATGRVTGPHLHWAVRVNGARVDPEAVLDLLGGRR